MSNRSAPAPAPASEPSRPPEGDKPRGLWANILRGGRPLAALLMVAAGIKFLVVAASLDANPLARHATSDSRYYLDRAAGIAGQAMDPFAAQPYHLPPLYPQLLARVPGALDGSFGPLFLLQALAGTAALLGLYLLAVRRTSRPLALAATGLALLYGPSTFFEVKVLGDSLACSLLVWVLVLADRLADGFPSPRAEQAPKLSPAPGLTLRHAMGFAIGLGLGCGTATLLRPQLMLLLPVLAAWLWLRRLRGPAVAFALTAGLVMLPSLLHNLSAEAGFAPVSDNGGVNLWLANTGPMSGTFLTHDEAFGDIERQAQSAQAVAETLAGRTLGPGEVSNTLSQAAWNAIWREPGVFLERLALRAQALTETFETGIVCVPAIESQLIAPLQVLAVPFGLLLALTGASLVILARGRDRRSNAPAGSSEAPGSPLLPMLAVAGIVLLTTLLFFHYSRFRLPLIPLACVAVSCAAQRLGHVAQRPGPGRILIALLVGVALAWVSWQDGTHHADTRAIGWTSLSEARLALATPDTRQAALQAADDDITTALAHAPALVRARLQAHRVALGLARFEQANQHLDAVAAVLPEHPQVLLNRAWMHALQHPDNRFYNPAGARELLRRLEQTAILDPELREHMGRLDAFLASIEARG